MENNANVDRQRKDYEFQRRLDYAQTLKQQIQEDARRKVDSLKMTESERKLNMRDLRAYENRDHALCSRPAGMSESPDSRRGLPGRRYGRIQSPVSGTVAYSPLGKAGTYAINSSRDLAAVVAKR